jgi:membrane protein involved in colicin uptake
MRQAGGRVRGLTARLAEWWNSTRKQRSDGTAHLRREARVRARQAAARMQDFKDSDRGQRAASKLSDLRTSQPAKRAEAAFQDLRASDAGKKAENALSDLRQREPVKKAEESARKAMHDLFSGGSSGADGSGPGSPGTSA